MEEKEPKPNHEVEDQKEQEPEEPSPRKSIIFGDDFEEEDEVSEFFQEQIKQEEKKREAWC